MRRLVIFGAGGFGAETAALIEDINRERPRWKLAGFLDDDSSLHGTSVLGYPVLGGSTWLAGSPDHAYVIAVGDARVRRDIAMRLAEYPAEAAILVHPKASVHESSGLGAGSIVCRGAIITVRVSAGEHLIANLNTTVGHDCSLGNFTTLHPAANLSGNTRTGERVEIGTGAALIPGVGVGAGSIVGAGAVVTRDLPPDCVAVGVPASVIRKFSEAVAG